MPRSSSDAIRLREADATDSQRLVLAYDDWHGEPAEDLCAGCGHYRRLHRSDGCEACDGAARDHRFELGQAVRGVAVAEPPGRGPGGRKHKFGKIRTGPSALARLRKALRGRKRKRAARREAKRLAKTAGRR